MADGYIFVVQNLRGRFKSEGTFLLSSQVNLTNPSPKNVNETTDAYDTIDWLVKHVTNTTGKVGMYGVSYDGLTAGMALLAPHPALKAVSEQASPADQWMNDDDHRYGALRESYSFEYAVYEQADKFKNTHFDFDVYDAYDWYLKLGPLSNINARYLHGSIPAWNEIVAHPNYDAQQARGVVHADQRLDRSQPQRRRLLGPGRSVGAVADLSSGRAERPESHELHRRRPVVSRLLAHPQGRQHRHHPARRARDGARVSREHRGALLSLLPARQGRQAVVAGDDVPDRIEHVAHVRHLAGEERDADQPVPAHRRHALVREAGVYVGRSISRVRLRPGEPGALSSAADLADLSERRLAPLGGRRPALRRWAPRRPHVYQRAARPRHHHHRRTVGDALRLDLGHGRRLRRQADRRLSGECAAERLERRRRSAAARMPGH